MSYEARFRSADGMERFLNAYDETMALWTVPYETLEVETDFGTTHINLAGSPDAPPLLLIHGGQISSPVWYANIGALSQNFRVYAPDVIDQMGRSTPKRKLKTESDCSDWLKGLLDALNLDSVPMIGHSHGGWQILNMAIRHPERVERMILLSPGASFTRLAIKLFLYMLPVLVRPTPGMFYWSFQWLITTPISKDKPHPLVEQFMAGAMSFKPEELSLGVVGKFDEDTLRKVHVPTLLLISENETVYAAKPAQVIKRALNLMPDIEAELIPEGKHLFPVTQAERVNERMLQFLLK